MAHVKRETREEARRLRREGVSVRDIAQTLGVSKGSVSVWVRDIELTPEQIDCLKARRRHYKAQNQGARSNRAKFRAARQQYQQEGRVRARENRPLHLAGCMLYWAEGAKHQNNFLFVNADPNMLRLCMRFLREEMRIDDALITLRIHCHSDDATEQRRIEAYWLSTLKLPRSSLRKTLYKRGSETSKHVLPNGICGIRVLKSVALVHHIYGAIQEYGGFENLDWLF